MLSKFKAWFGRNKKSLLVILIGILCWALLYNAFLNYKDSLIDEIPYSEFLEMCENGEVDTVYYSPSQEKMSFTIYTEDSKKLSREELENYEYDNDHKKKTLYPAYEEFRKDMLMYNVNLQIVDRVNTVSVIANLVSVAFPIIWIIIIFKMISASSKGLDKDSILQKSDVKFDDVIGQDEILEDIKFVAQLIKNPSIGDDIGVKTPKGILLTGSPGTGKTLIAKAIAGEAGVPFVSMGGSDFKELFVGMGAKRVRELFKIARENAPCIVFIDEIDSIGAKRDGRSSNSEDDSTINALLKEMDGFSGREGVFILAATNHPEKLDSALKRAGRFDRQIAINPPRDWKVRKQLFEHYLKDFKVSDDVDIDNLAKTVSGFTGADIAMICNEAGIIALKNDKESIDRDSLEEAIDNKVFNGNRTKSEEHRKDKEIVAYHEAGHAVCHWLLGEPISRASIQANTSGVGGVVFGQESDTQFRTSEYYENRIKICYAGRASEKIKFDSITQGASSDITQATQILDEYVSKLGFEEKFGMLDMDVLAEKQIIDKSNAFELMQEKSKKLYQETIDLLTQNYNLVEKLAVKLLEVETLSGDEIKELFLEDNE